MPTLDHRSPLVVELRDLGRRAGAMMVVERDVPAPADLGAGVAAVPAGSVMALRLRLESVIEGVLVSGTAAALVAGECSRCLDPISWDETVGVTELFLYEPGPQDEDLPLVEGDLLDLEHTIRDAVVLGLPLAPLCSGDCPGLCPQCGIRLADDPTHDHDQIDTRWARLAGLRTE